MVPLKTAKVRKKTHCSVFACMLLSVSNPTVHSFKFLRHKNMVWLFWFPKIFIFVGLNNFIKPFEWLPVCQFLSLRPPVSDPVPSAPIPHLFTLISHTLPHQPVVCILGSICIIRTQINYSTRVHHNEETGHPVQQSRSELWSRGISYLRLWPHRK